MNDYQIFAVASVIALLLFVVLVVVWPRFRSGKGKRSKWALAIETGLLVAVVVLAAMPSALHLDGQYWWGKSAGVLSAAIGAICWIAVYYFEIKQSNILNGPPNWLIGGGLITTVLSLVINYYFVVASL